MRIRISSRPKRYFPARPLLRGIVFATLMLVFVGGCGRDGETSLFRSTDSGEDALGDPYRFATADRETSPDEPPVIENDSLYVWVRYAGGCEDHQFHIGHEARGDTARVWLRHNARGDECEEDFVERLSFRLPDAVLSQDHVVLVDPESDLPLIVNR